MVTGPSSASAMFFSEILTEPVWTEMRKRHEERVDPLTQAQLDRASRGQKHPVYDFLFNYYSFRPSHLRRWHPGIGRVLLGSQAETYLQIKEYRKFSEGICADADTLSQKRRTSVQWILTFLENCQKRRPQFKCFGLHEWAMVYRSPEIRHEDYPFRLDPAEVARLVETVPICCSHFDAFRFFTPAARPLNRLQPEKNLQTELDQTGCLHVNMDLYKWAYKLSPFTPSELLADAFLLAVQIREVDMRASPYDLASLGFPPICIETPEGRTEYEQLQRKFTAEGEPIREQLIQVCRQILARSNPDSI